MSQKKTYSAPKVFEVELNQEQAILASCSTGVTNASTRTVTKCSSSCKRGSSGTNAAPPS